MLIWADPAGSYSETQAKIQIPERTLPDWTTLDHLLDLSEPPHPSVPDDNRILLIGFLGCFSHTGDSMDGALRIKFHQWGQVAGPAARPIFSLERVGQRGAPAGGAEKRDSWKAAPTCLPSRSAGSPWLSPGLP